MNKKCLTATAALLLCSSIPLAHAASDNPWYAGLMLGSAISSVSQNQVDQVTNTFNTALAPSGNSVTSASLSSSAAVAFSLFGGYRVDRYFSGELGYINFGSLGGTYAANTTVGPLTVNLNDKAQAFSLSALGTLPITHNWGLFARAGLAHYWETTSGTASLAGTTLPGTTGSDSGLSAVYGLGTSLRIGAATLRAEYDLYPSVAKDFTSVSGGVSVFGLSGQYAF